MNIPSYKSIREDTPSRFFANEGPFSKTKVDKTRKCPQKNATVTLDKYFHLKTSSFTIILQKVNVHAILINISIHTFKKFERFI